MQITVDDGWWGYLAGMIDGEGSITITKHAQYHRSTFQYKPKVLVTGTCKNLIEFLVENFGGTLKTEPRHNPKYKTCYQWRVMNFDDIERILTGVFPFLIVKRKHAECMLEFIRLRRNAKHGKSYRGYSTDEAECHNQIALFNIRGDNIPHQRPFDERPKRIESIISDNIKWRVLESKECESIDWQYFSDEDN